MTLLFDSEFSTILKIRKKAYWDLGYDLILFRTSRIIRESLEEYTFLEL